MSPRMLNHYREQVRPTLREEFGYSNPHEVPRVTKVVLNVGIGAAIGDRKLLDSVVEELGAITGQRAVITRARRSVSNFSLREGMPIGASVTLRRNRMYELLDRLVSVAIPRIRDFRGLSTRSFDGRGNYSMGIREQIIFPEIDIEKIKRVHGMDVTIVTDTNRDAEAYALLREMGFPFRGAIPVVVGGAAA